MGPSLIVNTLFTEVRRRKILRTSPLRSSQMFAEKVAFWLGMYVVCRLPE